MNIAKLAGELLRQCPNARVLSVFLLISRDAFVHERFAPGEIDRDEYEEKRRLIGSRTGAR